MRELKKIPGVDTLLAHPEIVKFISGRDMELVKYVIRSVIDDVKREVKQSQTVPDIALLIDRIIKKTNAVRSGHLKKVVNATGVVIHTNLGRSPYSREMLEDATAVLERYNNLEFDLNAATRGSRNAHAADLLKYFTGAEDVLVVNNNAAAVVLILRAYAKEKEVVISRGELIEIGGSFRMPDIIATSGCKMVEVGTTNKTKIADYENAISKDTGVLFKAHTSNYSIEGFTQEASLGELVKLGKKYNLPVVYDMGSGLLNSDVSEYLAHEPNVSRTLKMGVDLVSFSGDKLLGGPQAGIIAGKIEFVKKLKKDPLLRALRVDKLTLSFLETSLKYFLDKEELFRKNLFYKTLRQSPEDLNKKAQLLLESLKKKGVNSDIVASEGQFGGGSMPGKTIGSYSVKVIFSRESGRKRAALAEKIYKELLRLDPPVLGILRKGELCFDVLTLSDRELVYTAEAVAQEFKKTTVL